MNKHNAQSAQTQLPPKKAYRDLKAQMIQCAKEYESYLIDEALAEKDPEIATFLGEWSVWYGGLVKWLQNATNAQFATYAQSEKLDPAAKWTAVRTQWLK